MKQFILKWIKFNAKGFIVAGPITGITRYQSEYEAGFQAILFQSVFRNNRYYVEQTA